MSKGFLLLFLLLISMKGFGEKVSKMVPNLDLAGDVFEDKKIFFQKVISSEKLNKKPRQEISMVSGDSIFKKTVEGNNCLKEINSWDLQNPSTINSNWFQIPNSEPYSINLRKAVKIGKWIELEKTPEGIKVLELTSVSAKEGSFDKNCQMTWKTISSRYSSRMFNTNLGFNDQSLENLLVESRQKNKKFLIYLWSPSMIYSMIEFENIKKIAKGLKLDFLPIVDSRFSRPPKIRNLASVSSEDLSRSQNSFHFYMSQLEDHYPQVILISKGNLSPFGIPGIMPKKTWKKVISSWLSELEKPSSVNQSTSLETKKQETSASPKMVSGNESNASQKRTVSSVEESQCYPAEEYVPFKGDWAVADSQTGRVPMGAYSRISSDGQFVLRSMSGRYLSDVTLMKLSSVGDKSPAAVAFNTKMINEAFPVQGSWRFLVDVGGEHYRLDQIEKHQEKALYDFKAGVTGFYTTAAEMGSDTENNIYIRSLSWPNERDDSGMGQGTGQLKNRVYKIKLGEDSKYKVVKESRDYYLCGNLSMKMGMAYTLPMISANGAEFSALPINAKGNPSMRIFSIGSDHQTCEVSEDLGYAGSKMIFGKTTPESKASVIFKASSGASNRNGTGIYIYDRILKTGIEVYGLQKNIDTDSFPGLTGDGRVVVGAYWTECEKTTQQNCQIVTGYVRIDPYQSEGFKRMKMRYPEKTNHIPDCIKKN